MQAPSVDAEPDELAELAISECMVVRSTAGFVAVPDCLLDMAMAFDLELPPVPPSAKVAFQPDTGRFALVWWVPELAEAAA